MDERQKAQGARAYIAKLSNPHERDYAWKLLAWLEGGGGIGGRGPNPGARPTVSRYHGRISLQRAAVIHENIRLWRGELPPPASIVSVGSILAAMRSGKL